MNIWYGFTGCLSMKKTLIPIHLLGYANSRCASYSVRVNATGYVQASGETRLTVEQPAKEAYNRNEYA